MEAIKYYVKGAFVGIAETPAVLEQQEELIADLTAKVADLVGDGRSEDEALGMAIASMGDLSNLVREFATEEPEAPAAPAEPVVPTAEAYTGRLQLHVTVICAVGAIGILFVLSLLAAYSHSMDGSAAMWDIMLGLVGVAWAGTALYRFHQDPDAVGTVVLAGDKRLRNALMLWAGVCAFAFVANAVTESDGFWAWTVWIGAAAWPASIYLERRLLQAGKFVYPRATPEPEPAVASAVVC
jgi:hypothetical protein